MKKKYVININNCLMIKYNINKKKRLIIILFNYKKI